MADIRGRPQAGQGLFRTGTRDKAKIRGWTEMRRRAGIIGRGGIGLRTKIRGNARITSRAGIRARQGSEAGQE
jgi:hypothetical protein